jgi:hypothetical protein
MRGGEGVMVFRRRKERIRRELLAPGPNLDPLYARQMESFNKRADILAQCKNVYDAAAQLRGVNMHDVRSMIILQVYMYILADGVAERDARI